MGKGFGFWSSFSLHTRAWSVLGLLRSCASCHNHCEFNCPAVSKDTVFFSSLMLFLLLLLQSLTYGRQVINVTGRAGYTETSYSLHLSLQYQHTLGISVDLHLLQASFTDVSWTMNWSIIYSDKSLKIG